MAGNENILIPYHDATEEIRGAVDEGKILQKRTIKCSIDLDMAKQDFDAWNKKNENLLRRIFNTDEEIKKYKSNDSLVLKERFYLFDKAKDFRDLVHSKIRHLESIISRLTIVTGIDIEQHDEIFKPPKESKKVLIINGSKKNRGQVEKLIKNHEFDAVIPEKMTAFKNFDKHQDVDFALAFVSNGDLGSVNAKKDKLKPRTGQDTIFAIGFLIGKLGWDRVAIIIEKEVELPTHLRSVPTIKLESNDWREKLTKQIKSMASTAI